MRFTPGNAYVIRQKEKGGLNTLTQKQSVKDGEGETKLIGFTALTG